MSVFTYLARRSAELAADCHERSTTAETAGDHEGARTWMMTALEHERAVYVFGGSLREEKSRRWISTLSFVAGGLAVALAASLLW